MAQFNIVFKPSVEKDLRSIPHSVVDRIFKHIEDLKDQPFPRQVIKLSSTEDLYRIRVGDYRVIYGIDKVKKQVTIHYIRHRREAYR